ncbi:MAG: hypothetical protein MET45_22205 [Nostoc sp. LLA-1]|nr:hypothetical protein [Cyanocohniella sp. LLY]
MPNITNYHQEITNRITPIVDKLINANSLYQVKLNRQEMIEMLVELFEQFSTEEMAAINDYEISRRIRKILTLEAVAGTLNDLTPEQIETFDAVVAGR